MNEQRPIIEVNIRYGSFIRTRIIEDKAYSTVPIIDDRDGQLILADSSIPGVIIRNIVKAIRHRLRLRITRRQGEHTRSRNNGPNGH